MVPVIVNPLTDDSLQDVEINYPTKFVKSRGFDCYFSNVAVTVQMETFAFVLENSVSSIKLKLSGDSDDL